MRYVRNLLCDLPESVPPYDEDFPHIQHLTPLTHRIRYTRNLLSSISASASALHTGTMRDAGGGPLDISLLQLLTSQSMNAVLLKAPQWCTGIRICSSCECVLVLSLLPSLFLMIHRLFNDSNALKIFFESHVQVSASAPAYQHTQRIRYTQKLFSGISALVPPYDAGCRIMIQNDNKLELITLLIQALAISQWSTGT
ncbi:hypothetical protein Hypma_012117 [Hypsizygus marmoreus]|uniref:Uncharacterized protein n=1 Tax=Hypsizygus marmoreus TaxID=39966 RepID=A0A369JP46_HYPMA|nr:hypothetical protein Hypma_012117 [Hypsizygus marmoreus]